MALYVGSVPFEDVRDTKAVREAGKLTFGAVPVLEADGKILSQTQAMASYCAKLAGIHPEGAWEQAKVDEAINGCTDVTSTIGATFRLPDAEKVPAREKLCAADGRLSLHLGGLERLCADNGSEAGYCVGESLTVADLAIWRLLGWINGGALDGIPVDYVSSTFPSLTKLLAAVDAHPKVVEWKSLHPKFYA
jgi:glutathione S-transferase